MGERKTAPHRLILASEGVVSIPVVIKAMQFLPGLGWEDRKAALRIIGSLRVDASPAVVWMSRRVSCEEMDNSLKVFQCL